MVLQLDDVGHALGRLGHRGGDVVLQLLKGLVQEEHDGREQAPAQRCADLLRGRQLHVHFSIRIELGFGRLKQFLQVCFQGFWA